ncbi:hypothetical protein ACJVC5_08620 [Peredibacter sp. HCB2-198]|uniref:hypothetical protein n=1 Tax=Peredibacter sp. HCB2-198 TaxID=3383025 RepID=UPI0038B4859D
MKFRKFTIFPTKPAQGQEAEEIEVLFNLDHIISIKPIRISRPDKILNGFWIRTTNGKKYRASKIPDELLSIIGEKYQGPVNLMVDSDEQPFQ